MPPAVSVALEQTAVPVQMIRAVGAKFHKWKSLRLNNILFLLAGGVSRCSLVYVLLFEIEVTII
jgi:hypothetical protein